MEKVKQMSRITEKQKALLAEVQQDEDAYNYLQCKSQWEGMSLHKVLRIWGDPRKWNAADMPELKIKL